MNIYLLSFLGGFLCGSIPAGYLVGRAKGVDIRKQGSGNIGATNAARILGKRIGAMVLLMDMAKGLVPCYIASQCVFSYGVFAAVGTVTGHAFTPFLRFRGGRGVATALGSVLGLMPLAGLLCLAVWIAVLGLTKYVSVASISGALALPLWVYGVGRLTGSTSKAKLVLGFIISALMILRHMPNMRRLLEGKETKFHRHKP